MLLLQRADGARSAAALKEDCCRYPQFTTAAIISFYKLDAGSS
jgi:hypothetical protein